MVNTSLCFETGCYLLKGVQELVRWMSLTLLGRLVGVALSTLGLADADISRKAPLTRTRAVAVLMSTLEGRIHNIS